MGARNDMTKTSAAPSIWPSSKLAPRREVTDGILQTSSEYGAGPKDKGYTKVFIPERKAPFD
jgi:hypothetical protein